MGISLVALLASGVSAFYSYRQAEIAQQTYEAGREQIAVALTRDPAAPVAPTPGFALGAPVGADLPPLVTARWRAEVSNTSTTATASIVAVEVWSRDVDGNRSKTGANRLFDAERPEAATVPLAVEPGRTVVLELQASVAVSRVAARVLAELGLPQPTQRVEAALAEYGQDLFGNVAGRSSDGQLYAVAGSGGGRLVNPGVELVLTTSRTGSFSGTGRWYGR